MLVKSRHKPGVADISDLSWNGVMRWQPLVYTSSFAGSSSRRSCVILGEMIGRAASSTWGWSSLLCAPLDILRDFSCALARRGTVRRQAHPAWPPHHRAGHDRRGLPQLPPPVFYGLPGRDQVVPARPNDVVQLGLASHLKVFPDNEVRKGQLTMQLKRLREQQEGLRFASQSSDMPIISWESYQEKFLMRPPIVIAGFIQDVSDFIDQHPGGPCLITKYIGRDATTAFFGGVSDHSNAAHNLLSVKRVGVLHGRAHHLDYKAIPPAQRLRVVRYSTLSSPNNSAWSDGEGPRISLCTAGPCYAFALSLDHSNMFCRPPHVSVSVRNPRSLRCRGTPCPANLRRRNIWSIVDEVCLGLLGRGGLLRGVRAILGD
ncbi:hypothetical protein CERSUDRAFT_117063 [Gelatoporia subvermispora B]|uniref:Cytochrome b5 heme-binding domain-containing protein n=1 Tax=Ceriporiopsis subvermispora (strain B) TaxID=914234 RepID=M2R8W0_CERS8|nr:hypothetical protein CERSUDRAFT_117063 [Gelatoporia subvermispora B]